MENKKNPYMAEDENAITVIRENNDEVYCGRCYYYCFEDEILPHICMRYYAVDGQSHKSSKGGFIWWENPAYQNRNNDCVGFVDNDNKKVIKQIRNNKKLKIVRKYSFTDKIIPALVMAYLAVQFIFVFFIILFY